MAGRLARWFVEAPPAVRPRNYRGFVLLSVGLAAALGLHLVTLTLFWLGGVAEMVAVNLAFSLPAFAIAFALNRRGHHVGALWLAVVEVCAHQFLAAWYVGPGTGLQYFLLAIPAVAFSVGGMRLRTRVAMVALSLGTFLAILWVTGTHRSLYAFPDQSLDEAHILSLLGTVGLLALLTHHYARAAEVAEARLREQFDRAEDLLHNILPVPIAERLKRSGGVISDGFAEATVLFADLVGFTALSARESPERVVGMLNEVFSAFDELVEARGLEKIKTIGDAYMVAAGIPEPRPDHARAVAALALEMVETTHRKGAELGLPLEIRIGINSGPVVAGVIGRRKFIYDLWGDSVNLASRMESHGVPGRVQMTRATRDLLGDAWRCESRGVIAVKDKGALEVFLLEGRAPA